MGGDFFASPVIVGERIYASNVQGKTFVFEASPRNFRIIAQNQLGDEAYATPAICGSRIYLRVAKRGEKREEFLYCVGAKTKAEAKAKGISLGAAETAEK